MSTLSLTDLTKAVAGDAVAIRAIVKLLPAGGPSDKVFPPTYMKEGRSLTKYALETRKVDGQDVQTVLLDSVASQANRIEEALLEAWRRKELEFPVIAVDFTGIEGLEDLEHITSPTGAAQGRRCASPRQRRCERDSVPPDGGR